MPVCRTHCFLAEWSMYSRAKLLKPGSEKYLEQLARFVFVVDKMVTCRGLHLINFVRKHTSLSNAETKILTHSFLTLRFPKDDDEFELLPCKKGERKLSYGSERIDAVVMDGLAIGMLVKLPYFEWNTSRVNPVSRVPDRARITKLRRFYDDCRSLC